MKTMLSVVRLLVIVYCGICASIIANAAALSGRVRDANTNAYVLGATVTLAESGRQTKTGTGGEFEFFNLAPGTYRVVVSYMGYDDTTQTVTVGEAGDVRTEISVGSEVIHLGNFVVQGEREGQARALQQKRTADNIMDVVAADSMGKLPDGNAAEAVRRLPGVFAEIDQNEGRYIVVRGIDAGLNNITVNGVTVGSPESGTRGAAMDSVPADLINRIEVVKAVTPDMDHQAIGGSVNIVTPSAFDRSEAFGYGTLSGGYYAGPSGDIPYSASGTYGTTFGDGKWGIVVGASYNYRHYISNRRSGGNPWFQAAVGSSSYFPANEALFHYDVERQRWGGNLALEFRPSERHQFALRISDNRFQDEEGREQNNFEFWRTAFPASFTPTTANFVSGRATVEYRYYLQKHNITNYSFNGVHTLGADGDMRLDYTVAIGDATKKTPDRQDWEFRTPTNLSSTLDISQEYWTLTRSANFYDASNYPFRRVRFRKDDETEENMTFQANLKRNQSIFGRDGYLQVGGKFFTRSKAWNRDNVNYLAGTGANLFNLNQFNILKPAFEMFDGARQMSPQLNLAAAQALFRSNPNLFVRNIDAENNDSNVTDFKMDEDILAGYAMSRVNFGQFSVLAGVRVEHSEGDIQGTEVPFQNGVFLGARRFNDSGSYTNVLPGVHLRYSVRDNWLVRASWTNTIGRPNYPEIAGSRTFSFTPEVVGGNTFIGSVTEGNPDLKPYESMNFDLVTEYYFKNSGILSLGAFHKSIDNPIFTNAFTLRNTTFEGINFSTVSFSKPENADSGKVTGLEINYQQQLTMLPAPFDGLGFSVNYMRADSEETLFSRPIEDLRFAKQADNIYNIALLYEKNRIQARVAYTYTGDFIKAFGSDVHSDQYQTERRIIDAKVTYRINKHISVFADVINIGEEPLDEYAGFPNRNQATERYWLTANFGVNLRL